MTPSTDQAPARACVDARSPVSQSKEKEHLFPGPNLDHHSPNVSARRASISGGILHAGGQVSSEELLAELPKGRIQWSIQRHGAVWPRRCVRTRRSSTPRQTCVPPTTNQVARLVWSSGASKAGSSLRRLD